LKRHRPASRTYAVGMAIEQPAPAQTWRWVVPDGDLPGSLTVTSQGDGSYRMVVLQRQPNGLEDPEEDLASSDAALRRKLVLLSALLEGIGVDPPFRETLQLLSNRTKRSAI
jgi:hypothetical protein